MKLRAYRIGERSHIGLEKNNELLELVGVSTMQELIEQLENVPADERTAAIEALTGPVADQSRITATAPIVNSVKDLICVVLNYQDHVNESQSLKLSDNRDDIHTTYFGKRCDYLRGDGEDVIIWDKVDPEMDYEVELAVIISRKGRSIQREEALSYVFGYSIGNDFSSRALQRNHKQWFLGKGADGYTAMGPCVLINDDDVHHDFNLSSRINGEVRQSSNTSYMIKSLEDIIYEVSQVVTLVPGDIIFTGTPAGVGGGFQPPKYLKAGDTVTLEIEGIGTLTNQIAAK